MNIFNNKQARKDYEKEQQGVKMAKKKKRSTERKKTRRMKRDRSAKHEERYCFAKQEESANFQHSEENVTINRFPEEVGKEVSSRGYIPPKIDLLLLLNFFFCDFTKHYHKRFSNLLKSGNVKEMIRYVSLCEIDHMFVRVEKPLGSRQFHTALVPIQWVFSNQKRLALIKSVLANPTISWDGLNLSRDLHVNEYLRRIIPPEVQKRENQAFRFELVSKCLDIQDYKLKTINVKEREGGFKKKDWVEHYGLPKLRRAHAHGCDCEICNPTIRFHDYNDTLHYDGPSLDKDVWIELVKLGLKRPKWWSDYDEMMLESKWKCKDD